MKRRVIYWTAGVLAVLLFAQCHWIAPPLRKADVVLTVKTTGYSASMQSTGWKLNWFGLPVFTSGSNKGKLKVVGQTASQVMVRPGIVAVDSNVFPRGTKFYIPGYGWGIAEDVGGGINGNHLDLYFRWNRFAVKWGTKPKKVKVWYPKG